MASQLAAGRPSRRRSPRAAPRPPGRTPAARTQPTAPPDRPARALPAQPGAAVHRPASSSRCSGPPSAPGTSRPVPARPCRTPTCVGATVDRGLGALHGRRAGARGRRGAVQRGRARRRRHQHRPRGRRGGARSTAPSRPSCRRAPSATTSRRSRDCRRRRRPTPSSRRTSRVGAIKEAYDDKVDAGCGGVVRTPRPARPSSPPPPSTSWCPRAPSRFPCPTSRAGRPASPKDALASAGLKADVTQKFSEEVPDGVVISVKPKEGTVVDSGTRVALVVSKGPPPVTVPNLIDMPRGKAESDPATAGPAAERRRGGLHPAQPRHQPGPVRRHRDPQGQHRHHPHHLTSPFLPESGTNRRCGPPRTPSSPTSPGRPPLRGRLGR